MIEYVIEALKSVSSIKRIIVVGPVKEIKCRIGSLVEEVVPPGKPFRKCLERFGSFTNQRESSNNW